MAAVLEPAKPAIPVSRFQRHVTSLHVDSNAGFAEEYQVCTGGAWGGGAGKRVARWSCTRCVQEGHRVVVGQVKGWPGGVVSCGHNYVCVSADDNS